MPDPIGKYVDAFTGYFTTQGDIIVLEAMEKIRDGVDPTRAVQMVLDEHEIAGKLRDQLLVAVSGSVKAGAGRVAPVALKRWYLNNAYSPDGVRFSSRANNLLRADEIGASVRESMRRGESWRTAAQRLSEKGIQNGEIAKDVNEVLRKSRQAFAVGADTKSYGEYRAKLLATQRRINKLVGPSTSKLKRAYQDILDLTAESSEKAVDSAMRYAVYFKERSRAETITRTEGARAYDQAFTANALSDDLVVGYRSVLASNHTVYDICDWWAKANLYGLGAGVYPKTHGPEIPHHPNCKCSMEEVYEGEIDTGGARFDEKRAEREIGKLSPDKRRTLFGVRGSEQLADDIKAWPDLMRNYKAPSSKTATIPRAALYGK